MRYEIVAKNGRKTFCTFDSIFDAVHYFNTSTFSREGWYIRDTYTGEVLT